MKKFLQNLKTLNKKWLALYFLALNVLAFLLSLVCIFILTGLPADRVLPIFLEDFPQVFLLFLESYFFEIYLPMILSSTLIVIIYLLISKRKFISRICAIFTALGLSFYFIYLFRIPFTQWAFLPPGGLLILFIICFVIFYIFSLIVLLIADPIRKKLLASSSPSGD